MNETSAATQQKNLLESKQQKNQKTNNNKFSKKIKKSEKMANMTECHVSIYLCIHWSDLQNETGQINRSQGAS